MAWYDTAANPTVQAVYSAPFEIAHAAILTLPTTPIVIKTATETYEYDGVPTELFIPRGMDLYTDTRSGGYINVDNDCQIVVAYGSDWSADWIQIRHDTISLPLTNAELQQTTVPVGLYRTFTEVADGDLGNHSHKMLVAQVRLDDNLQDNALVLACNNASAGDFTGGHADNRIYGELFYSVKNFS